MVGYSFCAVLDGIEATLVQVEADVSAGIPQFHIVGLPDSAVNESRQRIRSAIRNSGLTFPLQRITVNLSPATFKKRGVGLDAAIAIAILRASGQLPIAEGIAFCAALGLSGQLEPVPAIINVGLAVRRHGLTTLVVSSSQTGCLEIEGLRWVGFDTLNQVSQFLQQVANPSTQHLVASRLLTRGFADEPLPDIADVEGLEDIKRTLTIAAVGGHHTVLTGPPGVGKTMCATRFVGLLPPLTEAQAIEVHALHQAAGTNRLPTLIPPLRAPHHSVTMTGMIGGTSQLSPGEATLAHHGVLLLDELLEFRKEALESLREPLTSHQVRLSRAGRAHQFPAKFTLLATLNPCPCGQAGTGECHCSQGQIERYWSRVSGPFLDRMEIVMQVQPQTSGVNARTSEEGVPMSGEEMKRQVVSAREFLAQLASDKRCQQAVKQRLTPQAQKLLFHLRTKLHLSERGADAVIRVASSIAALEFSARITDNHMTEAAAMRNQFNPSKALRM